MKSGGCVNTLNSLSCLSNHSWTIFELWPPKEATTVRDHCYYVGVFFMEAIVQNIILLPLTTHRISWFHLFPFWTSSDAHALIVGHGPDQSVITLPPTQQDTRHCLSLKKRSKEGQRAHRLQSQGCSRGAGLVWFHWKATVIQIAEKCNAGYERNVSEHTAQHSLLSMGLFTRRTVKVPLLTPALH